MISWTKLNQYLVFVLQFTKYKLDVEILVKLYFKVSFVPTEDMVDIMAFMVIDASKNLIYWSFMNIQYFKEENSFWY